MCTSPLPTSSRGLPAVPAYEQDMAIRVCCCLDVCEDAFVSTLFVCPDTYLFSGVRICTDTVFLRISFSLPYRAQMLCEAD